MGLSDFFRRRRDRESAIPASAAETGDPSVGPSAVTPLTTAATTTAAGQGKVAINTGVMPQLQTLQSLMAQHAVDLRSQPMEVRQAVVADLNAGGVPAKVGEGMNVTSPAQIQTVVAVLIKHGLLPAGTTVDTS